MIKSIIKFLNVLAICTSAILFISIIIAVEGAKTRVSQLVEDNNELQLQCDSLTFEIIDLELELCRLELTSFVEVEAIVTAYAPDSISCYPFNDGLTATGKDASLPGVAVDPNRIPYGSFIIINGDIYEADDTGISMRTSKDLCIDLRLPTHEEAVEWGRDTLTVQLIPRSAF